MSRITDEHQNPIEVEDEQTPVETETLDDDNYDDENKPIKKSVLLESLAEQFISKIASK